MPGGGKGGGASSTVTVHNGPVSVDADSTVEVVGLENISVTARLEPTPLRTESKQELVLPQPLRSESSVDTRANVTTDNRNALSVDLKPVAMDVCLNTSTSLPRGQIHQPFHYHVGLTLFGLEIFGMNFGGDTRTVLSDVPKRPLEYAAQHNATPDGGGAPQRGDNAPRPGARGLRVRIT